MTADYLDVTVTAADGYSLAARHFRSQAPTATVVVAGATGVPQDFYRRFSSYVSARGYDVLTVDYRGIGRSAPETLKDFHVDYRDWARLDIAALVDHAAALDMPVHLVGHSFGGQALGLLPHPESVKSLHSCATGTSWSGWMRRGERIRLMVLWNVVGPALTATSGYLSWSRLGMGEDLPLQVFRQWRRWSRNPTFWFGDPEIGAQMHALYDRITVPVTAFAATDDAWTTPSARDAFHQTGYRNCPVTSVDLDPRELGMSAIGHMGYFRAGAEQLWDGIVSDLDSTEEEKADA